MKNNVIIVLIGLLLFWSGDAKSYYSPKDIEKGIHQNSSQMNLAKGAGCSPSSAKLTMNFNDVSAFIEQGGSMFQDRNKGVAAYEVPKGSGLKVIFAGALWMGGLDVTGQLKLAAVRFREGNDFWAGPLTINAGTGTINYGEPMGPGDVYDSGPAETNEEVCAAYDQFYTIRKAEVIRYSIWWNACDPDGDHSTPCDENIVEPTNDELLRIYNWPAHGDETVNQDRYLAPFYDNDNNMRYDPDEGDYPWYDDILGHNDIECRVDRRISLYGDETNWWIFNDKGNIHTETNADPIGMEIRAQAFAFATNDEVNRMTFYNYELINRGTQTLEQTYFSQYLDADIGGANDDYVGCDVSRGLSYTYNGEEYDGGDAGNLGYGDNPPAIGCDFFEGPYQDPDGLDNPGPHYDSTLGMMVVPSVEDALDSGGIVYEGIGVGYGDGFPDNERFGMRRFSYYTGTSEYPYTDPQNASEFYNFMSGYWANGSDMYYGGLGQNNSVSPHLSQYMFPGDSDPLFWGTEGNDPGFDWTEKENGTNDANNVGDRRMVQSAGPFTLRPGAVNNITVGIVYGRGTDGAYSSVEAMKRADTKAQALFDACFRILTPPDAPKLNIQELENQLVLTIENPSSSNNNLEGYEAVDDVNITDPQWTDEDKIYAFEGYQIFQMVDKNASVSDILSPEKARLVRQCDIENDIDRIINFEFDEGLGFSIPVERVDGENKGIKHSFLITEDAFASGDRQLVNHKSYYFIAIAYAHNEFKKYDPNDATSLDGQKVPYISSRLSYDGTSIKAVKGVPHNPTPEADGTQQNIAYGSTPIITRIDGHGNGARSLELTAASEAFIFENGFMENPSYNYGRGPINVKVVDPLNVVGGYFECKFTDYTAAQNFNTTGGASWTIVHYDEKNGIALDSVSSQSTIDADNEQIIPQWGVSVQIHQENAYNPNGAGGLPEKYITRPMESGITFEDSSKTWLSFVQDNSSFFPTNWVQSGSYEPQDPEDCTPFSANYVNPCFYEDQITIDPEALYDGFLDGGFAPHKLTRYTNDYAPMAYYKYTGAMSSRNYASISYLPSVDIVLTNDPSKWTRCAVIELGRDPGLNVGNAEPGDLRQTLSVGKDGLPDGSGTKGMGWFPGYAIDLESGARLHLAFGENSFLGNENGADMIWNPTDRLVDGVGTPLMGGMQPVYVFSYKNKTVNNYNLIQDYPAYDKAIDDNSSTNKVYQDMQVIRAQQSSSLEKLAFYQSISWVGFPMLTPGHSYGINKTSGLERDLPCDVRIALRVNKSYKDFHGSGENGGRPMYSWSMDDIRTETGSSEQLAEALQMLNVVPNPYNAYSEYESNRLETRVKITNLPEHCNINIYSMNGKLVRSFKKDSPITSLDWDLNNHKRIPVASGVYLIHIDVPGVGQRVLKFFMAARQVDLQGT